MAIKDKNIYCYFNPIKEKDVNTTTWHFINRNIVIFNCLGFDIHNYVDEKIFVDRMLPVKIYLKNDKEIDVKYIREKVTRSQIIYRKSFMVLHSNIELTKDNVIFYFYRYYNCKKPSKLIIPLEIANIFNMIIMLMDIKDGMLLRFISFENKYDKTFVLYVRGLTELNFTDVDSVTKRLLPVDGNPTYFYDAYMSILLSRI